MERERIRLAKQELSEQQHAAAEAALAEQARVCEAAEATLPKLRAKCGPEWETTCGGPALIELLESMDLVDAQYLLALGQAGGVVPRWQELPESAKINKENAWRLHCWGGSYCLPVLVLSYPWMDADHPDRFGETLRRLLPILESMLARAKSFGGHATIGVFWDFVCVPQEPRSGSEEARYQTGLVELPAMYAHPHTIVLMMTENLPPRTDQQLIDEMGYANTRDFGARGWPYFERIVASLVKDPTCLWDWCHYGAHFGGGGSSASPTFTELKTRMRTKRSAPLAPKRFATELRHKVTSGEVAFGKASDMELAVEAYESIFVSAFADYAYNTCSMADAEAHLFYTDCGWGDREAIMVAEAVEHLANHCHPIGTRHISCRRDNHFSQPGLQRLQQARTYARRADASWLDLNLDAKAGPPHRGSVSG